MSELAQKKGETAAAWVARLGRVSTAGLSDYLLFVLGSWRRDASEKADGEQPDIAVRPAESAPVAGKVAAQAAAARSRATAPLEEAKRAVRALSAPDLAQFTFWLTHGRAD
ncbi:MAG TPA: hypothetical protein VMS17_14735 [Gemmataceae bacterium]|nr:hypothetical protein [Gemmataceae bacterium]